MKQYRRWPAVVVLILAATICAGALRSHPSSGQAGELEALQIAVARADATATDWQHYAEALAGRGRFAESAQAYRKTLDLAPHNRQVKFDRALVLARTGDGDAFYECMRDLSLTEAKLAVEVLDRPESQRYLSEDRFRTVAQEAASQARD
jgi:hypothetical protein